ncbi:MAG: OmpA family protein [Candidatus Accumulibacter phosphatis]|uniref:OmpA family protein n=3 Tax=Betaproteobacteria incertae sedis TaxID=119066 RepID=A0A080M3Q6_9PROT|nr:MULTISPECIES: OmpA family protein [Candidatus Accumulibacter]MCQ1548229.1 OmpA family protein [Candidatus Accumulibacter phosphatis]KFB75848.1 MAG: proteobacterial sortase system OmpA family protein [Candidatus Accumulibacter cognatus]MBL8402628.1 OmpA family protein [Accumulibacter sp.]MBN8517865.1 OmpA family protein [Accumulibacter sp.]MBO3712453.1 OmpA family protein [Accumulibacter sp.]
MPTLSFWVLCLLASLGFLAGCAAPLSPTVKTPMELEPAVKALAADIFGQVRASQNFVGRMGKKAFVVDPFIDAYTAEVNETSRQIEQVLMREVRSAFPEFPIEHMSVKNLGTSQYVVNGTIRLDKASGSGYYRVSSSVVDLKTGMIIANSEVWLTKEKLNFEPIASYKESPMYLKDKRVEGYIATTLSNTGELADKSYFDTLPTAAVLSEADVRFDAGDFANALDLYQLAESRADGKTMKTYSALYQSYRKLGQNQEAEKAFANLVDVGLVNNNLSTRFLFTVKTTDFVADSSLRSQYALWLRQIARRVATAGVCLNIVGHSSRSGNERYNDQLSQQRALAVQKLMQKDFPQVMQKTKAYGKGFRENIIGTGSDDAQDAIDRRVEFRVVECGR